MIKVEEIWKDAKDYEGLYQVSNLGRVRNVKYNRPLKLVCLLGYMTVNLSKHNKVIKKKSSPFSGRIVYTKS